MKTAEAVSKGHPDKVCDQISDAILDEYLKQDQDARVAVETMGGHGKIYVCGEVTSKKSINKEVIQRIALDVYASIGYTDKPNVEVNIVNQSPDIAQGVDTGGAGDQGVMIGYACRDNESLIPQELYLARKILKEVIDMGYGPDGKSQVTLENNQISRLVVSVQHQENENLDDVKQLLTGYYKDYILNGTGKFIQGGLEADTGLTGRKIVQDAYGPQVPVGGGAFSGKDPTKVDRSAAYMARKIAVNILKNASNFKELLVKIAYSIGIADPLMVTIDYKEQDNWLRLSDELSKDYLKDYDLTPHGIIAYLDLKQPIYQKTAENGHFGWNFNWDK